MLLIIMSSLAAVFLGGIGIIVGVTEFEAAEVVAVLSPALAAVGTVAAGVFGYSVGARGVAEAQRVAGAATEEATVARRQAAAAEPLLRDTQRIAGRAVAGAPATEATDHRLISVDDLNTLLDAAAEAGYAKGLRPSEEG
ncbi:MAG: hypothetical protein GTO22_25235 [Gemmatimonadales bacterium]|nr:hypothetical protein [Gemmatimonadales bacterium]